MILRYIPFAKLPFLLLLLSYGVLEARADAFDCLPTLEGSRYNLTSLGGEHSVNRTRETPPTKIVESLVFNLCGDLERKKELDEQDQCPTGTRACLTQVNIRDKEPDRIISVIPVAETAKLDAKLTVSPSSPKYLTLILHGSNYPQAPTGSTPSIAQSLNVTLWCDPQLEEPKITLEAYDGSRSDLVYMGPAGCPLKSDNGGNNGEKPGGGDNKDEASVGSGIGWFFLVLLLALAAYFSIGAYHNYSTYGARGVDLIPHRDFWQEVPYMVSDVVSHLCSSTRPRRSTRGGYISV